MTEEMGAGLLPASPITVRLLVRDDPGYFVSMSADAGPFGLNVKRDWDAGDADGEEAWRVPPARIGELLAMLPGPPGTVIEALQTVQGDGPKCEDLRAALSAMKPSVKVWDYYH